MLLNSFLQFWEISLILSQGQKYHCKKWVSFKLDRRIKARRSPSSTSPKVEITVIGLS